MNTKLCEICKKERSEVSLLIQGPSGRCVCNECIRTYNELLNNYSWVTQPVPLEIGAILRPHEIKAELDKRVIAQNEAKRALSVAFYNHELFYSGKIGDSYRKSNIILVGPTGVGKTFLLECIAEIIDIPILVCDATTFSEVGYVGEDVNHILELLYYKSDRNVTRMEKAIVFIDEIDKIASCNTLHSYGRDVSGAGVQKSLLKMIEGKETYVDVLSDNGTRQSILVNTRNILFVFSGAFVGLGKDKTTISNIIDYGMLPEFVGRSDTVIFLDPLSRDDLVHIMTDLDSSVCKMHQTLFLADGIELSFTEEALYCIADQAVQKGLGARGLFGVFSNLLYNIRYEAIRDGIKSIRITSDTVAAKIQRFL